MENKQSITTSELAKILGISRIAVFKRIKAGKINAVKDGRDYLISKNDLPVILGKSLSVVDKELIEKSVEKTISQYGETLRLLGKE